MISCTVLSSNQYPLIFNGEFDPETKQVKSSHSERSNSNQPETKYYNTHTLYVSTGIAYSSQLIKALEKAIKEFSEKMKMVTDCKFNVNLVSDRNNVSYGYGYIWVSDPIIYHVLLGKNTDGTDRIGYIADENWIPPEGDEEDELSGLEIAGKNWAAYMDEEEEIKNKYIRPQIQQQLPPLINPLTYQYDQKQFAYLQQLASLKNFSDPLPQEGIFQISPAYVVELDDRYCANVLCARSVPSWLNEATFKKIFAVYATDSVTKILRKVKDKKFMDSYPFVTINDKRVVFITFDPATRDAQFALPMVRKLTFKHDTQTCTLIFNHSFKTPNH